MLRELIHQMRRPNFDPCDIKSYRVSKLRLLYNTDKLAKAI